MKRNTHFFDAAGSENASPLGGVKNTRPPKTKSSFIALTTIIGAALVTQSVSAQNVSASQIVKVTATPSLGNGTARFPLSQIADGISADSGNFNGYVGNTKQTGTITFTLDRPHNVNQFYLWNDINVRAEGVQAFRLTFRNARNTVVGTYSSAAVRPGQKPVHIYNFPTKTNVSRVEMTITGLMSQRNTYLQRVEIREVAFNSSPSKITIDEKPPKETKSSPPQVKDDDPPEEKNDGPLEMIDVPIPDYVPGQVLYFSSVSRKKLAEIALAAGVKIIAIEELDQIGLSMITAKIKNSDSVASALQRLENQGGVSWAQPNHLFQLLGNSRSKGYALHGIKGDRTVKRTGKIVLIDSPVDKANPALKGAKIKQQTFGIKDIPAAHGTAIAELLVGTGEFGGVAQGAELISLAAFGVKEEGVWLSQTRFIARALNEAILLRPNVANLSFGASSKSKAIAELLDEMESKGICVVSAAGNGNGGKVLFPGRYGTTLSVTAIDARKQAYQYASKGPEIDAAAWGVNMNAAVPGGRRSVSGTSFATAVVSGSLLATPECSSLRNPAAMRAMIAESAQDLGAPGHDVVFGAGLFRLGEPKDGQSIPATPVEQPDNNSSESSGIQWTKLLWGALAIPPGFLLFFFWKRRRKDQEFHVIE